MSSAIGDALPVGQVPAGVDVHLEHVGAAARAAPRQASASNS